jgi:hypothetical protein
MPFSLPDKGEGANDLQSILFQEYLDVLIDALQGIDHVISGLAVTAQGSPNMTVAVAAGVACSNRGWFDVTGANGTITTADATNPRLDIVVITSAGAIAVRAGTPGATPKPPALTANDVALAVVYVPAADTTIATNQITDLRVIRPPDPAYIRADATRTYTSNTSSQAIFTSPAGGTLTLPTGTYRVKGLLSFSAMENVAASNRLINLLGAGTATVGSWLWDAVGIDGATGTAAAKSGSTMVTSTSPASIVTGVVNAALQVLINGTFEVTTGGTLIPSTTMAVAAASVLAIGSYLIFERIGDVNAVSQGRWS